MRPPRGLLLLLLLFTLLLLLLPAYARVLVRARLCVCVCALRGCAGVGGCEGARAPSRKVFCRQVDFFNAQNTTGAGSQGARKIVFHLADPAPWDRARAGQLPAVGPPAFPGAC